VGGNTIAFAASGRWAEVIGIDIDPEAIECAEANAKIYGVEDKIRFISGDCFRVLRENFSGRQDELVIFASPPWGGRSIPISRALLTRHRPGLRKVPGLQSEGHAAI
jgi:trimethylguanosine synthase